MNIAYFFQEPWEEAYVRKALQGDAINFHSGSLSDNPSVEDAEATALSIFVNSGVGEAELERFPKVKLIATRSTGFDHVDLAAAKKRGIIISTVPFYGENTVAEFTFALILALSRRVAEANRRVVETGAFSQENLRGFDLEGKTIGIVGGGHIGIRVVKIAKGFGMKGVMYDPFPNEQFAKESGFVYMSLDEVLANADVVTLHCPLTAQTRHLINKGNIEKIKRGAYLVNTARGPIVETEALVDALQRGIIAGAGLDVLEEEGETKDELNTLAFGHPKEDALKVMLRNHELMHMPNVLITPHNAFNSQEAMERILHTTVENIKSFIAGAPTSVVQ